MFHYSEFAIQDQSAFFIKKLWTLDNSTNPNPVLQKSILPNGCFNLAIINGPGIFVRHQNAAIHLTKGVYYCGQITKAIQVDILSGTKATMIQLFPWTPVHFLLPAVLSAFTDSIIPIHELSLTLPIQWDYLLELHGEAQIHRYLITHLSRSIRQNTDSQLITNACRIILERRGSIAVGAISTELHCSTRHLQKLFKAYVGLCPKDLAVIIKLRESVDDIVYPPEIDHAKLTDLALSNHFYDQAHFINTFRSIAGITPRQFNALNYLLSLKK
ncbi:helix-turn-helix domain-containing protein [Spirosoma agri]